MRDYERLLESLYYAQMTPLEKFLAWTGFIAKKVFWLVVFLAAFKWLPEEIGEYFCVIHSTRENHSFVNALTFSTNTMDFDSILLRKGLATVTHWQPLPPLPPAGRSGEEG